MVTGCDVVNIFFTDAAIVNSVGVSSSAGAAVLAVMICTVGVTSVFRNVPFGGLGILIPCATNATIHVVLGFTVGATIKIALLFAFILLSSWVKIHT